MSLPRPSLGAFILTYRRPDFLRRSLDALLSQSRPPDFILVVDNAADGETRDVVRGLGRDDVAYEATGSNLGSAGGTEYGTARLYELGFDRIYSGDDDNPPRTDDTLERLTGLLDESVPEVAGVGTVGARWDWRRGEIVRLPDSSLRRGPVSVDFIGGDHKLILRREAVEGVGPPNGDLFFGYPDLEHCLRVRRAGWELRVDGALMREYRQVTGKLGHRRVRSPVPRRSLSAVWRHYYTTRNYIHMMRETFEEPRLARREILKALGRSAGSWLKGPTYGRAFTGYTLRGVADGWRGRLGPRISPHPKD